MRRDAKGIAHFWRALSRKANWLPLASLAVAACLTLALLPQLTLRLSADFFTGTGEQRSLLLSDGSRLFLAPESAVDIAYSDGGRSVRLLEGSAFFEVQPDPGRPFSVDAGGTRTTVLGTAFGVDRTDAGAVVSVVHGCVRVEDRSVSPEVSDNLGAGDRLAVTRGRGASLTRALPGEMALWRRGELIARNLTISEVVESFRRYYSGVIWVAEPLASQRVTGLYRLDDPINTLAEMAEAHGATARQLSPWLLVLSH
ncbi:FecR family protein [Microbulbifer taiwanensis]